jgi:hypothetical protein
MPIAKTPWEFISVDIIGPLPPSLGFNAVMVVVDYLTKMKILIPTTTELTSRGTAELFRTHVFKRFGLPTKVVSDRGTQFVSRFMTELYKVLEIKGAPSTAWHPQTDGQTERANQEVEHFLRLYVNYQQDDWASWLDVAEFCLNDKYHTATKSSPFFLNHGYHPRKGVESRMRSDNPSVEEYTEKMAKARLDAIEALKKAAEDMKRHYDVHKGKTLTFNIGDKVWLDGRNLTTLRPMKKLDVKRLGPFNITHKHGKAAYQLKLPTSWNRVHPVFNVVLLSPFKEASYSIQRTPSPPGPIQVDDHPEFEVEEILASRRRGRGIQYLVKWQGYDHNENTWEPKGNVDNAPELIKTFHQKNPNAVRQVFTLRFLRTFRDEKS